MSAAAEPKKIRVAVVGTGEFGRNHARVYRELKGAELIGVYDQSPQRAAAVARSEEHTSELQSLAYLVCRLLLEKKQVRVVPVARAGIRRPVALRQPDPCEAVPAVDDVAGGARRVVEAQGELGFLELQIRRQAVA